MLALVILSAQIDENENYRATIALLRAHRLLEIAAEAFNETRANAAKSNYDNFPIISVDASGAACWENWPGILDRLRSHTNEIKSVICIERYPGVQELRARTCYGRAQLHESSYLPREYARKE